MQTTLVYTDDTGRANEPLSSEALQGRAIWLRHNCQSCHQFYGFGGFLGPDLTNASARLDRARLDSLLSDGSGQMPAFHLAANEITAVAAFLREVGRTGVGQARAPRLDVESYDAVLMSMIDRSELAGEAARGALVFLDRTCTTCHTPLAPNRTGAYVAPDLSLSITRLADDELLATLANGRPSLGMPPTGLSDAAREEILVFLRWQAGQRDRLLELASIDGGLPWFEFR
ncbi:MAG: c-type cytochrome [Gemmatimonadales bacterium]